MKLLETASEYFLEGHHFGPWEVLIGIEEVGKYCLFREGHREFWF